MDGGWTVTRGGDHLHFVQGDSRCDYYPSPFELCICRGRENDDIAKCQRGVEGLGDTHLGICPRPGEETYHQARVRPRLKEPPPSLLS